MAANTQNSSPSDGIRMEVLGVDRSQRRAGPEPRRARTGFVFDMEALVPVTGPNAFVPKPGAREAVEYLLKNLVPFVVLHKGIMSKEGDLAAILNENLGLGEEDSSLAIHQTQVLTSHSGFRGIAHSHGSKGPVLVLGGNGEEARKLAFDYGFKEVVTSADIAEYYDKYKSYLPTKEPVFNNAKLAELRRNTQGKDWEETMATIPIRILQYHSDLHFERILVFWGPENWDLDADLIVDVMSGLGYIDGQSRIPSGMSIPQRAKYIRERMPELHICTADWYDPGGVGTRQIEHTQLSFINFLMDRWKKATGGMPPHLKYETWGNPPSQKTLTWCESILFTTNTRFYQKQFDIPADGRVIDIEAASTVYWVGFDVGFQRRSKLLRSRWRSIMMAGQEVHPHAQLWRMVDDVRLAVEDALSFEYVETVTERGAAPTWLNPREGAMEEPRRGSAQHSDGSEEYESWSLKLLSYLPNWLAGCVVGRLKGES